MTTTEQTNNEQTKTYNVRLLTDSSKPEHTSDRLIELRWKETKQKPGSKAKPKFGGKAPAARCISVPKLVIDVTPPELQAAMQEAYETLQDDVARSIVEASFLEHGLNYQGTVTADSLTSEAVAEHHKNNASLGKPSKELYGTWFDNNLAPVLELALLKKLGCDETTPETDERFKKAEAAILQHRKMVADLAAPTASLAPHIATQLKRAVELAEDDKTRASIMRKLTQFLEPKQVSIELGL